MVGKKTDEVVGMVGKSRGQAAMEYLMTYGWALLVIVIVIAILLMINPFSAPQGCRFDSMGFICGNPVIQADGALYLTITNGNNNNVNICGVVCTSDKSPTPPTAPSCTSPTSLPRQATATLNGVKCQKSSTESLTLSSGAEFSGKLWLFYKNEEDGTGYPTRTASASVTAKAVAGGGTGTGTITVNAAAGGAGTCTSTSCSSPTPYCCTSGTYAGACRANSSDCSPPASPNAGELNGACRAAADPLGECNTPLTCQSGTCKTAPAGPGEGTDGGTCRPAEPKCDNTLVCCPAGTTYVNTCRTNQAACGAA